MQGVMRLVNPNGSSPRPATVDSLVRFAIGLTRKGWTVEYESDTHVVLCESAPDGWYVAPGGARVVVLYRDLAVADEAAPR